MPGGAHNEWNKLRESPRDWRVLRFIRRKPFPAKLVGESDDSDDISVVISGKQNRNQWTDAVRALHECCKIRALDKEGNTLRVLELDPDDPELRAEAEREESSKGRSHGRSTVPIISVDVPKLVDNVAKNLKEAFATGGQHQSEAFRQGFAAMTSVVNLCLTLLVRVESRLAAAEEKAEAQLTAGTAQEEPSTREKLVELAVQRAFGGGATNGAGAAGINLDPNTIAQAMQWLQSIQNSAAGTEPNGHT